MRNEQDGGGRNTGVRKPGFRIPNWVYNCVILLLLCVICYAFFLDGPFVSDDLSIIAGNPNIRSIGDIGQFFTPTYWNEVHTGTKGVFRPLRETSFSLIYAVLGPNPLYFHLASFLLHVCVVILLYFLARRLLEDDLAAVLSAAMFAVHPIHLEAVLWAKNLAELLAALFVILAFMAYLRAVRTGKRSRMIAWCVSATALYGLGLLCKESALALPGVLILYAIFARKTGAAGDSRGMMRKAAMLAAPMLILGLGYVLFQFTSSRLISDTAHATSNLPEDSLLLRPALVAKTYATYFGLLLFPVQLSTQYDFLFPASYLTADTLAYVLAFVGLSAAIIAGLILWRRGAYLLLWTIAFLVPAANIIPFKGRPLGDQRLYVASIGACLLFGLAAVKLRRRTAPYFERRLGAALLIGIPIVAMAALSLDRGSIWSDDSLFWLDQLRKSPSQVTAHSQVAEFYLVRGRDRAALDRASYAIAFDEEMLKRTGGQDEAVRGQLAQCYVLRARCYGVLGDHAQAAEDCGAAIRLAPNQPDAHFNLGLALINQNKPDRAVLEFLTATKLAPRNPLFFTGMAQAYMTLGENDAALRAIRQALTIDPQYVPALQLLQQGGAPPPN